MKRQLFIMATIALGMAMHSIAMDLGDLAAQIGTFGIAPALVAHAEGKNLLAAAIAGDYAAAQNAIDQGANVDWANNQGNTPLHEAAGRGHENIVELLLQHGANVNAQDNKGMIPLVYAAGYKDIDYNHNYKILGLLIEHDREDKWQNMQHYDARQKRYMESVIFSRLSQHYLRQAEQWNKAYLHAIKHPGLTMHEAEQYADQATPTFNRAAAKKLGIVTQLDKYKRLASQWNNAYINALRYTRSINPNTVIPAIVENIANQTVPEFDKQVALKLGFRRRKTK